MKIIHERQRINIVEYTLDFHWNDASGAGFSFPYDKDGNLEELDNPAAQENYDACISGKGIAFGKEQAIILDGINVYRRSYVEPAFRGYALLG